MAFIKDHGKEFTSKTRIIPFSKSGSLLPLIPLLSVLGTLGGGAAGIVKAINDTKSASQKLEEKRHGRPIKTIALGRKDSGLYLPYKTGCGLYLKPYLKNCLKNTPHRYRFTRIP